jgi:ABC-type transporter Mla subunit MlaD
LKRVSAATDAHTEQLKRLLDSTGESADEVRQHLARGAAISTHIEQLVQSVSLCATEQL